ncbi:MAG: ASKHA domain-containing protein, partial [Candidatus Bathycorpusculaceae bacterium]
EVTITVWDGRKIIALEPGDTSNEMFSLAVDIGTSKIVGYLVDLVTGKTLDLESLENPQLAYGEDIITRINYAIADSKNLKTLQTLVVEVINKIIRETCKRTRIDPNKIYEVVVVGNTAMHHLFLGIQPKYTALSPFTPAIKTQLNLKASEVNIDINPSGIVTVLLVIAGYVGADAVADVLATGVCDSSNISLLIDIGTNTEIFVGNSEDMLSCSCAAGPAFEGFHIKHGMKGKKLKGKGKKLKGKDIAKIFIAGAFGNYINPENAKIIGLIPDVPAEKVEFVGNTAIIGAKMALISGEAREKADIISKKVRYLELAADPDFKKEFLNATLIRYC